MKTIEIKNGDGITIFALILWIVIITLMSSCRSVHEVVKTDTNTKEHTKETLKTDLLTEGKVMEQSGTTIETARRDSASENTTTKTSKRDSTSTRILDVYLSTPDASGKQYPTRYVLTSTSSFEDSVSDLFHTSSNLSILRTSKVAESKSDRSAKTKLAVNQKKEVETKIDTQVKQKTKSDPILKTPLIIASIILSVGIIGIFFLVLKKYKLL